MIGEVVQAGVGIKAGEIYIQHLFSNMYLFEVPDFQRPFAWQTENFQDLFDDIQQAIQTNKDHYDDKFDEYEPYFLGSIILWAKELREDGSGKYAIIDGQQRLASLVILMGVMRDLVADDDYKKDLQDMIYQKASKAKGTKESVRLEVRDREKDFFMEYILQPGGTIKIDAARRPQLTEPKQHMLDAIQTFRKGFTDDNGVINKQMLEVYIKYLIQKVVLVFVRTNSLTSAFRLFNIINARGMELTNADLLKSENLRVIEETKREKYTKIWENVEEDIGTEKLEMLISLMRHIKLQEKAEHSIFEEFEDKVFKKEPEFRGARFIEYLSTVSNIYQGKILDGQLSDKTESKSVFYYNLVSIMRDFLPFNDWIAALIKFVDKFSNDSYLLEFLKKLEREIVVNWIRGLSFTERLTRMYKIIRIIEEKDTPQDVLSDPVFSDEIKANMEDFRNALDDISFYNKGRTRIPKYILLRINMERKYNVDVKLSYNNADITIEHILPKTATHDYWLERFNETERMKWTNRLGNLVLLNGRKNSQASNKPFPDKFKDYFAKQSDFDITNELKECSDWSLAKLKDRHRDLIEESIGVWIGQ